MKKILCGFILLSLLFNVCGSMGVSAEENFQSVLAVGDFREIVENSEGWTVAPSTETTLIGDYHTVLGDVNGAQLSYGTDGYLGNTTPSLVIYNDGAKSTGNVVKDLGAVYGGSTEEEPLRISFMFTKNGTTKMSAYVSLLNEDGQEVLVVGQNGADSLSTFKSDSTINTGNIALAANNPLGVDGEAATLPNKGKCWIRVDLTLDFTQGNAEMEAYAVDEEGYKGSLTDWGEELFAQAAEEGALTYDKFYPLQQDEAFNVKSIKLGTSNAGGSNTAIAFDNILVYRGDKLDFSLQGGTSNLPQEIAQLLDETPDFPVTVIPDIEGVEIKQLTVVNPYKTEAQYLIGIYSAQQELENLYCGKVAAEQRQSDEIGLTIPDGGTYRIFIWDSLNTMHPINFQNYETVN